MASITRRVADSWQMIRSIQPRFAGAPAGLDKEIREWRKYVVERLEDYAKDGENVEIFLDVFRKAGGKGGKQWVAHFSVTDRSKEFKNEYNWHGQNTSQWLFAGALVYEEDRKENFISIHT